MELLSEKSFQNDLIEQYKKSLYSILIKRKEIKRGLETLKIEVDNDKRILLQNITEKRSSNINKEQKLKAEDKIYSGIQGDLEYVISWLKYGHAPGVIRGIERRAVYEREKPFDPLIMQRFFRSEENEYQWDKEEKESVLGLNDKTRIKEALSVLSEREKEIYIMAKGNSISYGQIAKILNITKSTVSSHIYRAEKKIGIYIAEEKEGLDI
ncbi:sigma-70 family RNA polymerase sigma factor [Niallia sp. BSM11]|uniref:sigma-70 family RNA polymerase sigma factor n=1 Tax=Niallia sp. BSM11 TaxID=3391576 RepID=UPI0039848AB2